MPALRELRGQVDPPAFPRSRLNLLKPVRQNLKPIFSPVNKNPLLVIITTTNKISFMKVYWVSSMVVHRNRGLLPPWPTEDSYSPIQTASVFGDSFIRLVDDLVETGVPREEAVAYVCSTFNHYLTLGEGISKGWARTNEFIRPLITEYWQYKEYRAKGREHWKVVFAEFAISFSVIAVMAVVYYLKGEVEWPIIECVPGEKAWVGKEGGKLRMLWPIGVSKSLNVFFAVDPPSWSAYWSAFIPHCDSQREGVFDRFWFGNSFSARSYDFPWFITWIHLYWRVEYVGLAHRSGVNYYIVPHSYKTERIFDKPFVGDISKIPTRPWWCPPGLDWGAVIDWWTKGSPFPW